MGNRPQDLMRKGKEEEEVSLLMIVSLSLIHFSHPHLSFSRLFSCLSFLTQKLETKHNSAESYAAVAGTQDECGKVAWVTNRPGRPDQPACVLARLSFTLARTR
jgi:hypothetical protein